MATIKGGLFFSSPEKFGDSWEWTQKSDDSLLKFMGMPIPIEKAGFFLWSLPFLGMGHCLSEKVGIEAAFT